MTRMTPEKPGSSPVPAIQWPELNLPPSTSAVKGLTDEQHAAMQSWYLGVKNVVNAHNEKSQAAVAGLNSTVGELASKLSDAQSQIAGLVSTQQQVVTVTQQTAVAEAAAATKTPVTTPAAEPTTPTIPATPNPTTKPDALTQLINQLEGRIKALEGSILSNL